VFGKKRKHARKKEVERPLASSEVVENHIPPSRWGRVGSNEREGEDEGGLEEREKGESWERERKGKSMNLSAPFMSICCLLYF